MNGNAPTEHRDVSVHYVVGSIISSTLERMYERFDDLHKRKINDGDIIRVLREEGFHDIAKQYIEWSGAVDPDSDEDNTTMNPVVPDPADAPSYSELTRELTAAGIDADNLEQAMLTAVEANRITHGVFYAERSSDGVHWHVYKHCSVSGNGAYIATANSREGAQFILHSLGTGEQG